MLKPNENFPATQTLTSVIYDARAGHIVVLLSTPDADVIYATRKVWDLARSSGAPIRLIGVCTDTAHEPGIRRTLVTMASMLNHGDTTATIETLIGNDWLHMLQSRLKPQDMVVCWDEPDTGMWKKPISALLRSQLDVPLYLLSDPKQVTVPRADWAKAVTGWIGFLAIIIGFLFLQIKLYQFINQWTITLEILATVGEFSLIWFWNHLFQ